MFIHEVLRQLVTKPCLMLDLCAAPGGKSTAARTILPRGSALICNEPVRQRAQVLTENIQKFGHRDVIVTNNYPKDFRQVNLQFDVILADVPCSGEGMFRRDEGAIREWSPQNVEKCWRLQRSIVEDIWPQLKPGGLLIYSTCTFNTHENEENVQWICRELGAEIVPLKTRLDWNLTRSLLDGFQLPVYRFIPGISRGEGLFVAVLRKKSTQASTPHPSPQLTSTSTSTSTSRHSPYASWLDGNFDILLRPGDRLIALPQTPLMGRAYQAVSKHLKVLHAGITMGTLRGKDFIPHESLALAAAFNKQLFPRAELSYADAISYLRGESLTLPPHQPRGFVVVTFHDIPLGFVKNIGTRANNLYPQEWRIKSTHLPEADPRVLDTQ
jgi:NOL1/NOP2/fmu family ribosome biogenesis protein